MSNKLYHKQISNYWWNKIKVLFPQNKGKGRPILNPKIVLNAILWILKSGARRRDLPPHFGNWNSIYHTFRRWAKLGIFEKILQIVNKNNQTSKLIEMDSTYCKVHQSACSKLNNQEIGVSRGGKTTKIHALVNENFQLLNVMLTGGNVNDSECALALLKPIHITGKKYLPTEPTLLPLFVISLKSRRQPFAFLINPISRLSTILTKNCINNATSSNVFSNVLKTIDI